MNDESGWLDKKWPVRRKRYRYNEQRGRAFSRLLMFIPNKVDTSELDSRVQCFADMPAEKQKLMKELYEQRS